MNQQKMITRSVASAIAFAATVATLASEVPEASLKRAITQDEFSVEVLPIDLERRDVVQEGMDFWIGDFAHGNSDHSHEIAITAEMLGGATFDEYGKPIATHPMMLYDILPFKWLAAWELPLMVLLPETDQDQTLRDVDFEFLLAKFNIEVLVDEKYGFNLPDHSNLTIELSNGVRRSNIHINMTLDDQRRNYFIGNPQYVLRGIRDELRHFEVGTRHKVTQKPNMSFIQMDGFEFNADTVNDMRVTGIPVAYNFNVGQTRVESGFQWGGQSEAMPLRYPQRPFLLP